MRIYRNRFIPCFSGIVAGFATGHLHHQPLYVHVIVAAVILIPLVPLLHWLTYEEEEGHPLRPVTQLHYPDCPMTNADPAGRTTCICDQSQWAAEDGSHRTVPEGGPLEDHLRRLRTNLRMIEDGDSFPRSAAFTASLELDAIEKLLGRRTLEDR